MSKGRSESFTFQAGLTFGTNILRFLVGILASVIVARVLGPHDRGIYALALLLPALVVSLGNLGVASGTAYYVARKEFSLKEVFLGNLFLWGIIALLGMGIEVLIIVFFREEVVPGVPYSLLLLTLPLIPLQLFLTFFSAILLGTKEMRSYNMVQFLQSVSFLVFVTIALLFFGLNVGGAVGSVEVSWFFADLVLLYILLRRVEGDGNRVGSYLKNVLGFGLKSHISNILAFLNYRIDQFLLNFFAGATALGFYSVAVGLGEKLWMLSQSVGLVLFPTIAGNEDKRSITPVVAKVVFLLTGISAFLLGVFAYPVVKLLYSERFLEAVPMLQVLLPGIVILSASRVFANDIAGRGYPMINTYRGLVTVATNVILNILWIPKWGGVGAALASTTSYTVSFLLAIWFYRRIAGVSLKEIVLPGERDIFIWRNFISRVMKRVRNLR